MATRLIVSNSVFLDTAYAIALASITDEFHPQALALAGELKGSRTRLVTTWDTAGNWKRPLQGAVSPCRYPTALFATDGLECRDHPAFGRAT